MVASTFKLPEGTCPKCGESGRFVGMENHETKRSTNIITFECQRCGDFVQEEAMLKPYPRPRRISKPRQ
jgi:uncharacterized Zn finger protein